MNTISKELKERLGLNKSPVAIKFILKEEKYSRGFNKID